MDISKKLILLIFIFIRFSIFVNGQDSLLLKTPEDLGKQVLLAFKSDNFKLFKSLLITESDFEIILNRMDVSDSLKLVYRAQSAGNVKHLNSQAEENFDEILNKAKSYKINLKTSELKEIKFYSRQKDENERGDITIFARSGDVNFIITLSNCHKSDRWVVMNKIKLVIMTQ